MDYINQLIHEWANAADKAVLPIEDQADDMVLFWGTGPKGQVQKGCFSQWWPCKFSVDGVMYNCAEQYMMAMKAKTFNDIECLEKIMKATRPPEIKRLGRLVKGFNPSIWDKVKYDIVVSGNLAKFSQGQKLKEFLLSTGHRTIAEASPKDRVWGIGLAEEDPRAQDPSQWKGENLLGQALMDVREMLKKGQVLVEEYKISDEYHNRYWSRAQKEEGPDEPNKLQVSLQAPYFLSLHPARTLWYSRDKGPVDGKYVAIAELDIDSPKLKICDLSDSADIKKLGFPKMMAHVFQKLEPYFSFTSKTGAAVRKDSELTSKELKLAAYVMKGLAVAAGVKTEQSLPDLVIGKPEMAKRVFDTYDKLCKQAPSQSTTSIYPIYVGILEHFKFVEPGENVKMELATDLYNDIRGLFEGGEKATAKLSRQSLARLVEIRAYLDTFRSLAGLPPAKAGDVTPAARQIAIADDFTSTHIEAIQLALHARLSEIGYCGYFCREIARPRGGKPDKASYKCLAIFDKAAVKSLRTVPASHFAEAYAAARKDPKNSRIKGRKTEVYEDIIKYLDGWDDMPIMFKFRAKVWYSVRGQTVDSSLDLNIEIPRILALQSVAVLEAIKMKAGKAIKARGFKPLEMYISSDIEPQGEPAKFQNVASVRGKRTIKW